MNAIVFDDDFAVHIQLAAVVTGRRELVCPIDRNAKDAVEFERVAAALSGDADIERRADAFDRRIEFVEVGEIVPIAFVVPVGGRAFAGESGPTPNRWGGGGRLAE